MHDVRTNQVSNALSTITRWAAQRDDVLAVGLVGSWARNAAREDSDVDLVILTETPAAYRAHEWHASIELEIQTWEDAEYGPLWSRHMKLTGSLEVEFGFTTRTWASIEPLDAGTRRVIGDGCHVLFDPERILNKLKDTVSTPRP